MDSMKILIPMAVYVVIIPVMNVIHQTVVSIVKDKWLTDYLLVYAKMDTMIKKKLLDNIYANNALKDMRNVRMKMKENNVKELIEKA